MPLEGPPFAIHALYETTADILERIGAASPAQTGIGATSEAAEFILEKYLEEFIVSNFDSIFRGSLQLYADDDGQKVGQQFPTDVGPIDILAHDAANDALVVIELKKGRESDRVVGQVLRYMGWVKENLAESNQTVRGLIICQERDDRLKYAIRMVRDVSVKCYKVDFKLMDPSSQ